MDLVRIDYLRGNVKNPRKIRDQRFAELVNSLLDLPEMLSLRPVVYDEEGSILGGNMRHKGVVFLKAYTEEDKQGTIEHKVFHRGLKLNDLGETVEEATPEQKEAYRALLHDLFYGESIPGVEARGLTPAQKREFIIKDNASFGDWDWDELLAQDYGKDVAAWGVEVPAGWGDTSADEELEELEGSYEEQEITAPLPSAKNCPHCGEPI